MNTERLLRAIEGRLAGLPSEVRTEALDGVREELARERRTLDLGATVEVERERRVEAETLRAVLEAISRPGSLAGTIDAVLTQLARLVVFDSCSVGLREPDGSFRIIAGRGFPDGLDVVGVRFRDPLSDALGGGSTTLTLADVREDPRFVPIVGSDQIRSWAGIPLVVEGETIGLLCLDRYRVEAFSDEDVHRAKAVAFSAAAAIRKAQLLETVRRFATLMERVVQVDHAVFADRHPAEVSRLVLEGALKVGSYAGGVLVRERGGRVTVEAATDGFGLEVGATAPAVLAARTTQRIPGMGVLPGTAGQSLHRSALFLVPVATPDVYLGTLALVDPSGETPDDRLMEAYASRIAVAWFHALRPHTP